MEKIIFENFPSTNTPVNAENLNKIQNNVEKKFINIESNLEDSNWIKPTLINGVAGTNNYELAYRKKSGIVFLKGIVTLSDVGDIFTLPEGYRPSGYIRVITNSGNSVSNLNCIRISPDGIVSLRTTSNTNDSKEITLDGIIFVADN